MPVLPIRKKPPEAVPQSVPPKRREVKHGKLRWLDLREHSEADLRFLERNFKFHPLDFEDLRSTKQRPKVDEYKDYLFLIFHVPYFDKRTRRLGQEEVDVFIGPDYLITLHSGRLKVLAELVEEAKRSKPIRNEVMSHGPGFLLYEIISRLYENSFPMLDRIAVRINEAERIILSGTSRARDMVEELSHLKLEIINFRRIIRPQRDVVRQLEDKKKRFLPERLDVYFDDVNDTLGRTTDLLDNYREVIQSLEDTHETFIQHRTNNVVKVLTLVSLVTLPGAAISGLLAMNLKYPFPVDERLFFIAVGFSVAFAAILFIYMYAKRWL